MIDRVVILAPSRASSLPQGFRLVTDSVCEAETCGGGLLRHFRTFIGPSRNRHVLELFTDGIDAQAGAFL